MDEVARRGVLISHSSSETRWQSRFWKWSEVQATVWVAEPPPP